MFYVPLPCPKSAVAPGSPASRCVHRGSPPLPGSQLSPASRVCGLHSFDPRQAASTFNQPLNWDTSSVMNMKAMFYVR